MINTLSGLKVRKTCANIELGIFFVGDVMKTKFLVAINIFLSLVLIILLCAGCASSTNTSKTTKTTQTPTQSILPPQIPPQSTFEMDFSDFAQSQFAYIPSQTSTILLASYSPDRSPMTTTPNALGDHSNWVFAALNVGFWNLAGFVGLAVPVAAFEGSIKQTPVKQPDGSWIWTYSITVQGVTYTAELHGKYTDTDVRWDMYITKENDYTNYLWYYGESNSGSTQGYWVLKDKPSNPNDLLRIDWDRDPANGTGDIKYTNIVPGSAENGGYISFTAIKGQDFDRSYTIYNKVKNETTYIEWNGTTKVGHVKDSVHFGDSNWHSWDSSLNNKTSP
jgi:hypothetical protein